MAVSYRGPKPERNYTIKDFYDHGIVLTWAKRFYDVDKKPALRAIFRSNGLLGEIRTTCYGDTYAVDVRWGWYTSDETCLTTECKTIREAKSILFEWFKSKGYVVPKAETDSNWNKNYLEFNNVQLNLFPISL